MKKVSHYAALMRQIADRFNYSPCKCQVRCFEKESRNTGVYVHDVSKVLYPMGVEIKGIHGGRQSFESVFTWTMVQFQYPTTNLVRLTKAFNDAMVSIGLEPLTDFQLSMVIAFEKHCPAQIGKFNSIFIGMPGMYMDS